MQHRSYDLMLTRTRRYQKTIGTTQTFLDNKLSQFRNCELSKAKTDNRFPGGRMLFAAWKLSTGMTSSWTKAHPFAMHSSQLVLCTRALLAKLLSSLFPPSHLGWLQEAEILGNDIKSCWAVMMVKQKQNGQSNEQQWKIQSSWRINTWWLF